ncbi:hypothetical protein MUK70_03700 [Dyadobacter chenwenxiniae]|uniref:Uncharacterized protein n=1 Tax=Dyadobacter chenwenxiniae TaxID=2906456 RepID=A0A9X1PTJ5_9BACT|nr:hypothetical protein [Dyadobacter chenwenxiniae]MCF0065849.1 hypothetical protein [Dyadobacter chenwenxiniae]UON84095.1 hypothetical protein MUK70_03700 [Dyadobacter chenwenxiniae]
MSNVTTLMDQWAVKDLEDGSWLIITVNSCTELGKESLPGIQVLYMGNAINFEPVITERWAYQATKAGVTEFLLADYSWMAHEDLFIKNFLIVGDTLKTKIEVKTRSSKLISKEYELPFTV